jgi:hypothetical protein
VQAKLDDGDVQIAEAKGQTAEADERRPNAERSDVPKQRVTASPKNTRDTEWRHQLDASPISLRLRRDVPRHEDEEQGVI